MRIILNSFFFAATIFYSLFAYAEEVASFDKNKNFPTPQSSVAGYWQTIDEHTHQARSIVQICLIPKLHSDELLAFGRIIQVNYDQKKNEGPADQYQPLDKKDPAYGQLILGMIFIKDMQADLQDTKSWREGKIIDPENGKTYDAEMTLTQNGEHLKVRGYIGIPLFGRTQTWNRIDAADLEKKFGTLIKDQVNNNYYMTRRGNYVFKNYDSCDALETAVRSMINERTTTKKSAS